MNNEIEAVLKKLENDIACEKRNASQLNQQVIDLSAANQYLEKEYQRLKDSAANALREISHMMDLKLETAAHRAFLTMRDYDEVKACDLLREIRELKPPKIG